LSWIRSSGYHFFGFRNSIIFTEQGRQPCVQSPIWKIRSLYLCAPVRRDASQSQSHIATDGQSVCLSWCRAPAGAHDQIFLLVWKLLSCPCGAPSLTRGRVCHLSITVGSISPSQYVQIFTNLQFLTNCMYNIYKACIIQAEYSKLCPISSSFRYNGCLVTWGMRWRYFNPSSHGEKSFIFSLDVVLSIYNIFADHCIQNEQVYWDMYACL
jgi:hypothetical protein